MGDNPQSACAPGRTHSKTGSAEYTVIHNVNSKGPGEKLWRWCHKCQGLHHGGFIGDISGRCPGGRFHTTAGSGKYRVQYDGQS